MNKKTYVNAYYMRNLGDDLFIKILSERYKENFEAVANPKYKYKRDFPNIKFNSSIIKYYFLRIYERVHKISHYAELKKVSKSNLLISIGGSIFIENCSNNELDDNFNLYKNSSNYYILGANFGPYRTVYFKNYVGNKIINLAKDVSFRDKFSYNCFKTNNNVRVCSDIVFSLDTSNIIIKETKRVIFSIIDCATKGLIQYKELYERKIIEMIKYFDKKGYSITLMSFCKKEGDEKAIKSILNKINSIKLNGDLETYFYRTNINEALNILGDSQIIVGTRFHANILGLILKKKIIPIAYSDKTINVMNDIGFTGKILDLRSMDDLKTFDINEQELDYNLNTEKLKLDAMRHFEKLDRILKKSDSLN